MIKMKCLHCAHTVDMATEQLATLACQVCGSTEVEFNRAIIADSFLDAHVEKVKAKAEWNSSYQKGGTFSSMWTLREPAIEPKPKKEPQAKAPVRRGRPKKVVK